MQFLPSFIAHCQRRNGQLAFQLGFKHATEVSPREAESLLRSKGLPDDSRCVTSFCEGAHDGAANDRFRLALLAGVDR